MEALPGLRTNLHRHDTLLASKCRKLVGIYHGILTFPLTNTPGKPSETSKLHPLTRLQHTDASPTWGGLFLSKPKKAFAQLVSPRLSREIHTATVPLASPQSQEASGLDRRRFKLPFFHSPKPRQAGQRPVPVALGIWDEQTSIPPAQPSLSKLPHGLYIGQSSRTNVE